MLVQVDVQVVKLRRRNLEDGVPLLDQRLHDRDVVELVAVGRRERRRRRRRRLLGEVVQDVGSEEGGQVARIHLVTR